jgi:hypothetical protein
MAADTVVMGDTVVMADTADTAVTMEVGTTFMAVDIAAGPCTAATIVYAGHDMAGAAASAHARRVSFTPISRLNSA